MDYETINILLNSVNSVLESSDGPSDGFISVGKYNVSRSQMTKLKEGLEGQLEKFE